jgi:glucose-1-phosphate adenylyltransferase
MRDVLAVILGGGQGKRLFPLTHLRSKPAVPIGGKYRLIDIPISNCLHAGIRRIFVLTQFNSASLNRHVGQSYRLDVFSRGFVEILAAEQTPDNTSWYQGTADAVRQAARHFVRFDAQYYLILAGDHLYRMDYTAMVDDHVDSGADITIAAQPVAAEEATSMGILCFDRSGQIASFEEKPDRARLDAIGSSVPGGTTTRNAAGIIRGDKPFVASMGVYVFSREVLLEILDRDASRDFGREVIPASIEKYNVRSYLYRGYWADVGTVRSFYDANIMLTRADAPFQFYDTDRPIYTRPRFLPGASLRDCAVRDSIVAEGSHLEGGTIEESVVGIRTVVRKGTIIRRSVLLGADYYATDTAAPSVRGPELGIGRDVLLDGVIVDKNARIGDGARLTNAQGVSSADGDGYFIRDGIIVVPKDAIVKAGTVV